MYRSFLDWALHRSYVVIGIALVSLIINVFFIPLLGFEFQPTYDSGEFNIMLSAPPGTSMEKMAAQCPCLLSRKFWLCQS